jgi:ubiquinone/menaquinone biosynthesis C-methylase UbiE
MTATPPQENSAQGLSPEPLMQMTFAHAPQRILTAGVQLQVFSHIAAGRHALAEIAGAAGASERGMRMLLDALTGFQLLAKSDGLYHLTPMSEKFLVCESPDYLGAMIEMDEMWHAWGSLTEIVRTGQPDRRVESQETAEKFFSVLVRSLHVANREPARRTAEALGAGNTHRGMQVLDVACGSGIWGIGIAEADTDARITAQDFPGLFATTREYVSRHGVADRFDYLPGDLKTVDFGENRFDLALLGNIVHSEGEESSRDLFRRLHRALKPGGRIAVIDMIPNDERTAPPFALIFAINMLINTEVGDTYTLAEYTAWLNEAGFTRVETADIGSHSPLIIGIKE